MPKIILIDDNSRDQRRAYGADYIDENIFNDIVDHFERVNQNTDFSFLENALCVLINDSLEDFADGLFNPESHIAKNLVIKHLNCLKIPYVCFSDGHTPTGIFDSNNNIVNLKKSEFYNRLRPFLEHYQRTHSLEFRILAYGKYYARTLITKYVRALFQKIEAKQPWEILSVFDIMPSDFIEPHYLEEIIMLSQPAIGIDYYELLDYIEDNDVTVNNFKTSIINILHSVTLYGKNTCTWK